VVPKKENFPVLDQKKDRTGPEKFCSHTPLVMGNFYFSILAQKKDQKAQRLDFQALNAL